MLDGRYLHLPVVDENEEVAGMVNVLQLTFATLEQVCGDL
jgi:CBS domain-containing protein